jgi:hypothetical protein
MVRFLEEAEAAWQHRAVPAPAELSYPEAGAVPSRSWGEPLPFPTHLKNKSIDTDQFAVQTSL